MAVKSFKTSDPEETTSWASWCQYYRSVFLRAWRWA